MARPSRRTWLISGAVGIAAALLASRPTRVAKISCQGRVVQFALPIWSVRTRSGEGSSTYLGVGDPTFLDGPAPWREVEQMGAARSFAGEGMKLKVLSRKRTRWLTEMEILVVP